MRVLAFKDGRIASCEYMLRIFESQTILHPGQLAFQPGIPANEPLGKLSRKRSAVCSYGEPEPLGIDENLNNVMPGVHALAIEARVHKLLISSIKSRTNAAALELLSGYIRR